MIRNIHGQGRYVGGRAVGEVFVDFGEVIDQRFVRFAVRATDDGTIELAIDGEMRTADNGAPSLRILINNGLILDTTSGGFQVVPDPRG